MPWTEELELAVKATQAASACLRELVHGPRRVLNAQGRDIKLQADRDAEHVFLDELASSGYPVLAEESGARGDVSGSGPVWVVDPLDGTMNFSRGIPFFSTSVALLLNGEPQLGVVHDLVRGETFSGMPGGGCFLNGAPVHVSEVTEAERGILATGLPTYRSYDPESLSALAGELGRFKKVRMLGSAALMLAYVASGRIDAYWEDDIMLWDVAAGLALVNAAGGYVSSLPSTRHPWGRYVKCASHETLWVT